MNFTVEQRRVLADAAYTRFLVVQNEYNAVAVRMETARRRSELADASYDAARSFESTASFSKQNNST